MSDQRSESDSRFHSWIERLELSPHPEGGWYRETIRSRVVLERSVLPPGYPGDRAALTSILYLLPTGVRSRWHRVRSEELWMHHRGDDLRLGISSEDVRGDGQPRVTTTLTLGCDEPAQFQGLVPAGCWQEAAALPGPEGFSLVGCVVVPGFEFEDFELYEESK